MEPYRILVDIGFLRQKAPPSPQKKLIYEFLEHLAMHPFQEGDFQDIDETGRTVEVKVIGKFAVSYWADHAVKEIKATKIIRADPK